MAAAVEPLERGSRVADVVVERLAARDRAGFCYRATSLAGAPMLLIEFLPRGRPEALRPHPSRILQGAHHVIFGRTHFLVLPGESESVLMPLALRRRMTRTSWALPGVRTGGLTLLALLALIALALGGPPLVRRIADAAGWPELAAGADHAEAAVQALGRHVNPANLIGDFVANRIAAGMADAHGVDLFAIVTRVREMQARGLRDVGPMTDYLLTTGILKAPADGRDPRPRNSFGGLIEVDMLSRGAEIRFEGVPAAACRQFMATASPSLFLSINRLQTPVPPDAITRACAGGPAVTMVWRSH